MTRNEKILSCLNNDGAGLEIGPSYNPVAPKSDGFDVEVVDWLDREGLRRRYAGHPVDLDAIEEVDYVWKGEDYATLTGRSGYYDWVIASHIIEHMPDLIGFLNGCEAVLKRSGVLSLAVPDKRYCFDTFRPVTGLGSVVEAHRQGLSKHPPGIVAEYYLNVVSRGGKIAWSAGDTGDVEFIHTKQEIETAMREAADGAYLDIHSWCFVPSSFRLMIHDLHSLGMIQLKESAFFETAGCEFYVALSPEGRGIDCDRLALLERVQEELAHPVHSKPK